MLWVPLEALPARIVLILVLAVSISLPACDFFAEEAPILIEEVLIGNGALAEAGSVVTIAFRLTLENGDLVEQDSNFEFRVGSGAVMSGLDQGVQGMRVNGTRRVTIPPNLAFGSGSIVDEDGNVIVPPNATIIATIHLLAVE
jgi:FKBP-type peptidyl-prolyl cis-trans isomerase